MPPRSASPRSRASVLIGRDGKISHIDLGGKRLEKAVAEAIAQKP